MRTKKEKIFKNVPLLGGASLFNDIGSEMISPLLPFYITNLGGTGLAIGLISGLREGLASLFKLFGGWFSDRIGKRKPFIFFGYFISVIFRFFLAIVNSWQYIIGFVSLERFGKLRDAPRDALISQSTRKRGKGFGLQQMMDTSGAIIGTIIVIFLFWKLQIQMKTIIFMAAGISLFSLLPLFFVKEPKTKAVKKSLIKGIKNLNPKLKYFIFVTSVFTFANFGLYMFLLLRAKEITGNILMPLILYAIFSFVYAFFVAPLGSLSDKIGRRKVILAGYILFFIVSLSFIYIKNLLWLMILFILYGLVYALTQSNQRAFVSDFSGKMKGTSHGFYNFIIGIVSIIGGSIAGILWDINYKVMFTYISVIAFLSIIFLLFVREK
jgi:MFS family permease